MIDLSASTPPSGDAQDFLDDLMDHLDDSYASDTDEGELKEVEATLKMIRKALREDGEFFIEFFLPELDMHVPRFHLECWGLMTDQEKARILLAIPRDHAKTTLAKLVVVWYWLFTKRRFCVYLSNTNAIALGACKDIIGFLETDNFVSTFGKIKMIKSSENDSLWVFNMPMGDGKVKKCILRAIGQGQQMRGINIDNQRPDIAVVDDVEDLENTGSELLQKKLDRWMYGPFLKALARKHKIVWLGNMLSKTSLLARQAKNPRWNPVVFGSLVEDVETGELIPLWPEKWTVEELKADYIEYRDLGLVESWMCEMMNMPGHGQNGFRVEQLYYLPAPLPDQIIGAFLTLDPAFGMRLHNDESAITVHVIPRFGVPMSILSVHGHMTERGLFDTMVMLARQWDAWVWGIEAIAAQKLLIPLFTAYQAMERLNQEIEILPLSSGKADPKASRIKAFVNMMAEKEWALSDEDFDITNQILSYDLSKKDQKDDIVDSAAYGPIMYEQFKNLILAKREMDYESINTQAQVGTEVAGV